MPTKKAAKADILYKDPRSGEDYLGCGASLGEAGDCHRMNGHDGSHRVYLYQGDDPIRMAKKAERSAKAAAWNALTPEQQEAERASRRAKWASLKAAKVAGKPVAASAPAAHKPAVKQARAMGSGPVGRVPVQPSMSSSAPQARKPQRKAAARSTVPAKAAK